MDFYYTRGGLIYFFTRDSKKSCSMKENLKSQILKIILAHCRLVSTVTALLLLHLQCRDFDCIDSYRSFAIGLRVVFISAGIGLLALTSALGFIVYWYSTQMCTLEEQMLSKNPLFFKGKKSDNHFLQKMNRKCDS